MLAKGYAYSFYNHEPNRWEGVNEFYRHVEPLAEEILHQGESTKVVFPDGSGLIFGGDRWGYALAPCDPRCFCIDEIQLHEEECPLDAGRE